MERSLNRVQVSGFTKESAKLRETSNGNKVATLTVVLHEGREAKRRTFLQVVCWKGLAERAVEFAPESRVRVTGRLELSSWKDKTTGEQKRQLRIVADDLEPVGNLATPPSEEWRSRQPISDSDIPF